MPVFTSGVTRSLMVLSRTYYLSRRKTDTPKVLRNNALVQSGTDRRELFSQ